METREKGYQLGGFCKNDNWHTWEVLTLSTSAHIISFDGKSTMLKAILWFFFDARYSDKRLDWYFHYWLLFNLSINRVSFWSRKCQWKISKSPRWDLYMACFVQHLKNLKILCLLSCKTNSTNSHNRDAKTYTINRFSK